MALDVTTIDDEDKKLIRGQIIVWDYHGGPNQHFYIKLLSKVNDVMTCAIINASTGFVLEAPHPSEHTQQVRMVPRGEDP